MAKVKTIDFMKPEKEKKVSKNSDFKTDREIFEDWNNEEEIMNKLNQYMDEAQSYYDEVEPYLIENENLALSYVDEATYPFISKIFLPFTARHIKTSLPNVFNARFGGDEPYFQIKIADTNDDDRREDKLIQSILKNNLYQHNKFYLTENNVLESEKIYGTGILYDGWSKQTRRIRREVKTNVQPRLDKDGNQVLEDGKEVFDSDIKLEIKEEVIKDANEIKFINVKSARPDPISSVIDRENARFFGIFHYKDRSEIKEQFENWEELFDKQTENKSESSNFANDNNRDNSEDKNSVNTARENKQQQNNIFEIYEIWTGDHLFWFSKEKRILLKPRGVSELMKFANPFDHGQWPYRITYHKVNAYGPFGYSQVDDIGVFNRMINDNFNSIYEAVIKKLNPVAVSRKDAVSSAELMAAFDGEGVNIEVTDETGANINNSFKLLQLDFNERDLSALNDKIDGYMQLQDAQTDQLTGSTDVSGRNKTLGGLKLTFAQAQALNVYTNTVNKDSFKNQIYRMITNIFQFMSEDIVTKLHLENKSEFFEVKRRYLNSEDDPNDIIRENSETGNKIYYLDELAKIKYDIDITFASAGGSKTERLNQLDLALTRAIQLISFGIDPKPIIREYMKLLNVNNVIKPTDDEEDALIQEENVLFQFQFEKFRQMVVENRINEEEFVMLMETAIREPNKNEDHRKHLASHPQNMTAHRAVHEKFLAEQEAIATAIQERQLQNQAVNNVNQSDLREKVGSNPSNLEIGEQNAGIPGV